MPGGERGAVPQIHHPLPGFDASPKLLVVDSLGR
jgi:hypothetical protein